MTGCIRTAGVGRRSRWSPRAIPSRQGLVVGILIGKTGRTFSSITGRLAAFAVCRLPVADIAIAVAAAASAATTSATTAASPRSPVGIAVTFAGRFLALSFVTGTDRLAGKAAAFRQFIEPFSPWLVKTVIRRCFSGPATGGLFAI
jgi:hypothetical protein